MRKKLLREIPSYLFIFLGCLIMALGMNLFLVPNRIAAGGLSGIGIVVYTLFNFPVGMTVLILNIPLFLISWKVLGTSFGVKTLFATLCFSFAVDGTAFLEALTYDMFLATLFGGV
ncbi:MAG: YitT family protein, partial [Spirochaetales bacterium]|nr:YitT family protein [Spirochaetales bacterium]